MEKKFKLCFIVPVPPPYGGIANWVQLIKEHIVTKQEDIDLNIVNIAPKNRMTEGRTLWNRIFDGGIAMIWKWYELNKLIKKSRPDVIHMTTSGQFALIRDILLLKTAKKKGVPTVYHIRFGRIKEIAENNTSEWKLISEAMNFASEVMVIDDTTYHTIKQYLPTVNVVCVPNPIDISNLPESVVSDSKSIMFLGWVVKTKGIEELLSAWEQVYKKHDDWKLRIVGPCKGKYLEYLKSHYLVDGVFFEGEKCHEEAVKLLNSSNIFILPSYTEGFPNAVLEAMALSKPIIATRVGAIPEMLADDCGVLVNPKNIAEIVDALEYLIMNPEKCNYIGNKANKKLNLEYTLETIFNRYLREWRKLSNRGYL